MPTSASSFRASSGRSRLAAAPWRRGCVVQGTGAPLSGRAPEYWELKEKVNPYCFMDRLFAKLEEGEIVACADGTACVTAFQARSYVNASGCFTMLARAPMG
jgi:acetolactate synthase-1/2/3 large subunit